MDSETKLEYQRDDFSPQPRLNATAALIAAAIDNLHPAAPHAAPREGEPEPDAPFRDHDYPSAARSIALNLAEFCDESLPYPAMIADAARRAASRLASQQAALDAAGEDTKRLDWIAEHSVSVSNGYTADGSPTFPGTHARVMLCDTVLPVVPRESPHWLRAAIDAARASHPEAE